ncbi:ODHCY [Symbiodinium sp. CCMP2456]|nr:ODHCY [Symbiodinium sp. CCMP2456]
MTRGIVVAFLCVLVQGHVRSECRDASNEICQVEDSSALQVQASERAASVIDVNDKGWMHHDSKNASFGGTVHGSGGSHHPPDGSSLHCARKDSSGKVIGPQIRIRKEIHKTTDAEFSKFANCVRKLKEVKSSCNGKYRCIQDYPNSWDSFLAFHMNCHRREDEFWVCHRHMMYDLETALQKICNDCDVFLPYWNSFRESGDIWGSVTWGSNRYGNPFGLPRDQAWWCYDHGWSQCVMEGIGKEFLMDPHADKSSCSACLSRQPYRWAHVTALPVVMAVLTSKDSFETIQAKFEAFHVDVHTNVGGNMANLPDSTLDPVFWLHHGVVDFMFTFWQAWQYNNEKEHPTCRSCKTCNSPMTHYRVRRKEWMGRWNPEHKCVELPCSNPVVCIGYDGYIEPGIWTPPAPPPPSPHKGWGRWGWRRWLLLQNESLQDFDGSGESGYVHDPQELPVVLEDPDGSEIVDSASPLLGADDFMEKMQCEETINKIQKGSCSIDEIAKHVVLTTKRDMTQLRSQCAEFWGTLRGMVSEEGVEERINTCWTALQSIEKVQETFRFKEPTTVAEKLYGIQCNTENLHC